MNFKTGEKYGDSNYGRMLKHFTKDWTKDIGERKFAKESSKYRLNTWKCYTMTRSVNKNNKAHKGCKKHIVDQFVDKYEDFENDNKPGTYEEYAKDISKGRVLSEETHMGVMTVLDEEVKDDKTKIKARNSKLRQMLDEYYPVSLYYGLPNGKKLFEDRLAQILDDLGYSNTPDIDLSASGGGYIHPVPVGTYTQSISGQRFGAYGSSRTSPHSGTDFAAYEYTPIFAPTSGVVKSVTLGSSSAGNYVVFDHDDGYTSRYLHMANGSVVVKAGQKLAKGQLIGGVGTTGQSTGNHLHWDLCTSDDGSEAEKKEEPGSFAADCYNSTSVKLNPEMSPFGLDIGFITFRDEKLSEMWVKEMKENMLDRAKKGDVFILPGVDRLGMLAARCETGGYSSGGQCVGEPIWDYCHNPTRDASYRDSGGWTCGGIQIASLNKRTGTLNSFEEWVGDRSEDIFKRLRKHNYMVDEPGYQKEWTAIVEEYPEFKDYQLDFMQETHYEPMEKYLDEKGFGMSSRHIVVKEVAFDASVQYRYNFYYNKDNILSKGGLLPVPSDIDSMSDKELAKKIVNATEARRTFSGRTKGKLKYIEDNFGDGKSSEDDTFKYLDLDYYYEVRAERLAEYAEKNEGLDRSLGSEPSFVNEYKSEVVKESKKKKDKKDKRDEKKK